MSKMDRSAAASTSFHIAGGIVAALVFLLLFLVLDFGLLLSLGGALLGYVAGALIAGGSRKERIIVLDGPAQEDYQRVLKAAESGLAEIEAARDMASHGGKEALAKLALALGAVLGDVRKDPAAFREARRFLESYLNSTLKIVHSYAEISSRGLSGSEISEALAKGEAALVTVANAYTSLRSRLVEGTAMDLGAEVDALERSLSAEGLDLERQ